MKQSKIAIVGMGNVGSTAAYTLMLKNLVSKIILVDINEQQCRGHADDLSDAIPFSTTTEIVIGTLRDAGQADIAIITCGVPQKLGQSRMDLLHTNYKIIKTVIRDMKPLNPALIIIVVTNPVDILTSVAQHYAELPRNQIFGSGTLLDSQRLRHLLREKMDISERSIHLYVLGEHGDTQFAAWSCARIAGIPLLDFSGLHKSELERMADSARHKALDIIADKGTTAFGVAACISAYCENILFDTKRITPVSCYNNQFDVCFSMPAVLGKEGVEQILFPPLNKEETMKLEASVRFLKNSLKKLNEE